MTAISLRPRSRTHAGTRNCTRTRGTSGTLRGVRVLAVAALVFALCAGTAAADPHPNTQGGVAVDQAFQIGNLDNINLFNGALTVTVPLGIQYPLNAAFSYQFTLVANSNPWDFWTQYYGSGSQTYSEPDSQPSHCSNAGLGWRVSFGAVMFGYPFTPTGPVCATTANTTQDTAYAIYEAPDGSQHLFYATLHPNDPDDSFNGVQDNVSTGTENVLYTRDGSYLRLKRYTGYSEIEFPDGKIHHFGADGRITQIRDPWNNHNQVNFSYLTTAGGECPGAVAGETSCWEVSDTIGRTHWVYFRSDLAPYNDTPPYGALISRIVLSSFGGTQATYQFNYTVPSAFGRGCPMYDTHLGDVTAPLLTSVTLPDGSSYAPGPSGYLTQPAGAGNCTWGSASLTHLTLPTLGSLGWQYQVYSFPGTTSLASYRQSNPGIASRTTYDAQGNVVGAWNYSVSNLYPSNPAATQAVNTVTDPLGNRFVRYFSIAISGGIGPGPNIFDYGRPYTPQTTMPGNPNLYLSEQVYDAAGNLKRTEYTRYERDLLDLAYNVPPDATNNNGREAQHETVYDDGSQGGFTDITWDGVGHYRQSTTDGTFAGNDVRTEYHAFNPTLGTYSVTESSNTYTGNWVAIPASTPWVLGTQTYQYAQENGAAELQAFCYDATTGFLLRRRLYIASATDPGTLSTNDVIQVFTPAVEGDLASEAYFGGDNSPITPTSSDLCAQTLPNSPEYQINHGYAYGALEATQYLGSGFYSYLVGIDSSTGLPEWSRDTAGIQTNLSYDSMGRLVYTEPRDGAWTQYLYHPASSPSSLASLTIEKQQNGSPGTLLAETQYDYDALGRMVEKSILMPSGAFSSQTTAYNPLNWKTAVSAQGTPNANLTQYLSYDPFGRVGLVRPPDSTPANGYLHDVSTTYGGVQTVSRTVHVGTSWTGAAVAESPATTTETYDRFGRLASVTEPSGAGGSATATSYAYDAGNRLSLASTTSAGTTQTRVFSYDHRGFLDWEVHPETSQNYTLDGHHKDYLSHDSRGHAHRTIDGANDLSYTFDLAERPVLVYNTAYGGNCTPNPITTPTCVKRWTYDNVAAGALGRVSTATRYNHIVFDGSPNTSAWTYTYTYGVPDGQVTQRTLQHTLNGQATGSQEAFNQSWTYTQLYKVATETYPNCASTFTSCGGTTPRTVQDVYTNGYLTSLPGYTSGSGITYYPNGMVATVTHANGVVATYGLDPYYLNRPSSISAGAWTSGTYAYDGSGNITQVGHGYYLYDPVSRLTTAEVETNETDASSGNVFAAQSISYDAFGNIQQFVTNGVLGATPTTAASNHLTSSTYDASGNLLTWNGDSQYTAAATYQYDELNMLQSYVNGAQTWYFLYDADDERVWSFQPPANGNPRFDRYTLRGLDAKVKRTFELTGYQWFDAWTGSNLWEDYVYRDSLLLAGIYDTGKQNNMDVDHLGTPRLLTGVAGNQTAYHVYLPYGTEATPFNQDTERMKFTGHERDLADPTSPADDLDYMHARFANPITGRFLSVDRHEESIYDPQELNRYSYVSGNPLHFVDPDGWELQAFYLATGAENDPVRHSAIYFRNDSPGAEMDLVFSNGGLADGVHTLASYLSAYGPANPTSAYRLKLNIQNTHSLLRSFMSDWDLRARLVRTSATYSSLFNNCAQYVTRKIIASGSNWDSAQGALSEIITVIDTVNPKGPILVTNEALDTLRVLGYLGGVERDLSEPKNAPTNVTVYWSFGPPPK